MLTECLRINNYLGIKTRQYKMYALHYSKTYGGVMGQIFFNRIHNKDMSHVSGSWICPGVGCNNASWAAPMIFLECNL